MPGVPWMRYVLVTPHPLQLQGLGEVEPCELCCVTGYLEILGCKRLGTQCKAGCLRRDLRKSKGMRSGWDSTVCKETRAWWALNIALRCMKPHPSGGGGGGWFLTLHRPKSCLQDKLPHQPSWISLLGTYSRVAWGNGLSCWLL